jgi:hypothetical protein
MALADLELRQGHAETAEALLREIGDPDRALLERVERVRAQEDARKKDAERLKAIERDRDPTIGRASRLVLAGLFAGSAAIGASLILSRTIVVTTSYGAAVVLSVFFPPAVAVSFLMRRRLFANAYSRNIAFAIYVALGVCLVDRWAGALAGLSVADVLTSNLWVTVGALATAAFAVERKLFGAVVPLIIAAIATRLFPSLATAIFSVAVVLSVGAFALLVWRHAPRTRDQ